MLLKFALIWLFFQIVICKEVNVAGLFEQNEDHEKAFSYAIERINREKTEDGFIFSAIINNDIEHDNPYSAFNYVCLTLSIGIVAIFGPKSSSNIVAVQSICDTKEIPHIVTRWNYWPVRDGTEINFYPHPSILSKAYFDVIMALEWRTFTILYEDDESLLRLSSLIRMAKTEGVIVTITQLDRHGTGNYRTILKEVKKSDQRCFVIDCKIDHLTEVLLQIQQMGLMNNNYNYFITNLDAHTEDLTSFQYSETVITGIRIINPANEYVQEISNELFADSELIPFKPPAWKLTTEMALIIDAARMFSVVLDERQRQSSLPIVTKNNRLGCNTSDSWEHGFSVVNILKTSSFEGLTGPIKFNSEGFRSDFHLGIFQLKEGGVTDIGTWNSSVGCNLTGLYNEEEDSEAGSLRNKTFIIITTLTEPYGMLKVTSNQLYGNDRFEGFGIDLIQKLSEMEGFNYTFILRDDKKNGEKDEATGKWSGMIGDILEYRADLAITDFTITSDRAEAVDFTVPFMNLGISILFRKPSNAPPSFFSFADPFALDTWIALAVSYFVVSFSFYVMGRLCPDEWTNPYPCIEEPEHLINQFSLWNSIWFVTGSLMAQGSEIAPIAMSTRMVAGMWWFFCLLIVASYTANLAAFLATENPVELFKDIQSLYDNAPLAGIKYGAKAGGATLRFFTNAEDGIFKKVGEHMKNHPENVKENEEGVRRAEQELYAFFMESTTIEYNIERHCDLKQYGKLLDDKGYGIAMRKGSPYRKRLSTAILKLQSSQVINELKTKWWKERRGGGQCEADTSSQEATPLGLVNVEGCFWVTIFGTILSAIFVIVEHLLYVFRVSKRAKISYRDAFKQEYKFYTDFNSNVKPVINSTSSDTSKSGTGENKSKTRSTSKSPPACKSKSSKESQKSNSNADSKSPVPYGFIASTSLQTLKETQ